MTRVPASLWLVVCRDHVVTFMHIGPQPVPPPPRAHTGPSGPGFFGSEFSPGLWPSLVPLGSIHCVKKPHFSDWTDVRLSSSLV